MMSYSYTEIPVDEVVKVFIDALRETPITVKQRPMVKNGQVVDDYPFTVDLMSNKGLVDAVSSIAESLDCIARSLNRIDLVLQERG